MGDPVGLRRPAPLGDRVDFYTHLGHLGGHLHGVSYKLAAPLAAIGLRRLPHLHRQLEARRRHARRVLDALPADGILHELPQRPGDAPNYYNLVLTVAQRPQQVAQALSALGLPPDSVRYGYRPGSSADRAAPAGCRLVPIRSAGGPMT